MNGVQFTRRRILQLAGAAGVTGALTTVQACGSSVGGGEGGDGTSVKVGLLIPQAGVYSPLGVDMKRGWDLWIEQHGGKFGDYTVETVVADEGEKPQTGVPAAQRLLQQEQVDVIVGIVNSATALGVRDLVHNAKKTLLIANAGAEDLTKDAGSPYIWRVSFSNGQPPAAMGRYLGEKAPNDSVYLMAPDYAAGTEAIGAFRAEFEAAGGTIAGEAQSPFGTTQDYQPFLSEIRRSGAKATFCFYAGSEAVQFVKQYRQFGLASDIPLYGSGFLTEGSVLDAQADAALGVHTALHYTSELDNPANAEFVRAYGARYDGAVPTVYSVQTWDAANVLSRALQGASGLGGDALSKTLSGLGPIDDSPRGSWEFESQNPKQKFYVRKVEKAGGKYVNVVVDETEAVGQPK